MSRIPAPLVLCGALACALLAIGCDQQAGGKNTEAPNANVPAKSTSAPVVQDGVGAALVDEPLEPYRAELLEMAFDAALVIPKVPHLVDRSRRQDEALPACFKLKQTAQAMKRIQQIENWRRGTGWADFAYYCLKQDITDKVDVFTAAASQIAESSAVEKWQKDRINVRLARVYAKLGNKEKARQLETGVGDAEVGKVASVHAAQSGDDEFDQQDEVLDGLVATGRFEPIINAMFAYSQLYNRFYDNAERRALVREKIKTGSAKLPLKIQLELHERLAEFALDQEDKSEALVIVNEAHELILKHKWFLEDLLPVVARFSVLRFRAGDEQRARNDVDEGLARFKAEGEKMRTFKRGGALRPLAEAYQAMGDTPTSLEVYRLATEQGAVNPNARPRALDLSRTCQSMAEYGVEPDSALWSKLRSIREGLGAPW